MKDRLIKLIDLKSIITILLVSAFIAGWFAGLVKSSEFIPFVTMVLTFYFAKQKKEEINENQTETVKSQIL